MVVRFAKRPLLYHSFPYPKLLSNVAAVGIGYRYHTTLIST